MYSDSIELQVAAHLLIQATDNYRHLADSRTLISSFYSMRDKSTARVHAVCTCHYNIIPDIMQVSPWTRN